MNDEIAILALLGVVYCGVGLVAQVPPFNNREETFGAAIFGLVIFFYAASDRIGAFFSDPRVNQQTQRQTANALPGAWRGNISQSNWPDAAIQAKDALWDHHIQNNTTEMHVICPRRLVRGLAIVVCLPDGAWYLITNIRHPILIVPLNQPAIRSMRGIREFPDPQFNPVKVMQPNDAQYQSIHDAIPFREADRAFVSD